jgi:para-aminobenzoate synthetase component I
MRSLIQEVATSHSPESLVETLRGEPGIQLLLSPQAGASPGRFSFVVARPFLTLRSYGVRCGLGAGGRHWRQFGNPWRLLSSLMSQYELRDEWDLPLPLGGCFGYWGYDLKQFVEPRLSHSTFNDLKLPDCHLGFYDSLVAFDHALGKVWVISTGMEADGDRSARRATEQCDFWRRRLEAVADPRLSPAAAAHAAAANARPVMSNLTREDFLRIVARAQAYIRSGDIYQVNLSQRLTTWSDLAPWDFFQRLAGVSPAPFAAYLDCGGFQLASSSPELFLRLSGRMAQTCPIKGTRPRAADPVRDAQLAYELRTSSKEMAELVMITDLLRNDLGRVCEFGSVQVPELARLDRFAQVQHLVSVVEGQLRSELTHADALAACFPGGSITGAPKVRAMEIIEELEPTSRGPYTGTLGFLGFNRESRLAIIIRTAIACGRRYHFPVGAGIVADSVPEAEHDETLAKAGGFLQALGGGSSVLSAPGETRKAARS